MHIWGSIFLAFLLCNLLACGSSGNNNVSTPPPPPSFSLAVSPLNQSLNGGSSVSVSLSALGANGFDSQINVAISGLPSGISIAPSNIALTPGTAQKITLTAAANVPYTNSPITFTGTSGSLTNNASLSLSVVSVVGTPGRTRYVRTDATTEYFTWINLHWAVYDPNTSRFFVTDPFSNRIYVFDAGSETKIAAISVPGAYAIDSTPDHSTLYVGTLIGDVYTVDPVGMKVTQRFIASQIGPNGYSAMAALVLANGQIALLGQEQGIASVDGSPSFAIWGPSNNSFQLYQPQPCHPIFGFSLTVDRTKVILDSGNALCEVDASSGTVISTSAPSISTNFATTPDGKYIVIATGTDPSTAALYDAGSLASIGQIDLSIQDFSVPAYAVSSDSTTLFLLTDSIIYAYNIATGQQTGWVPNIYLSRSSGGSAVGPINSPFLQAVDNTCLYFGPLEEGVGFVDLSSPLALPVGTAFESASIFPPMGPAAGGTQTQGLRGLGDQQGAIYFGAQEAPSITPGNLLTTTTPPGPPGPVDIYAFSTDGGEQFVPDGFSYGPTILEVTPNMSTAEGDGTGYVYGYGLGPVDPSIPPDLQITVGGASAQITSFSPNAYGVTPYPFQLEFAGYTIPAGVTGSANVVVTNNSGTATPSSGFTYLPATQQFPLAGASLVQGIYDPYTSLYYFTDTNKVQVFSRTQGKWLSPIPMPAPQGATQQLWGIALSPNGSNMAVSDASARVIYIFNPSNPASVKTFTVGSSQNGTITNPCGLAVSDSGNVYYAAFVLGGTGSDQFFKLNTTTRAITDYGLNGPGLGAQDMYLRVAISSDNSTVYFNELGNVFRVNTATDQLFPASVETGCCYGDYELSVAANQSQITATSYLYDSELNGLSYYALNDREVVNISYIYGAKFSPDARLLFQPSANGIDVLDGNLGNLLDRISLPFSMSSNYDALVSDGTDNILVGITGTSANGIAVMDLTSIPEPSALIYRHYSGPLKHGGREQHYEQLNLNRARMGAWLKNGAVMQPHVPLHVTAIHSAVR
jgi:hypothetical protein